MKTLRRLATGCGVAVLSVAATYVAHASHFRFGHVTWQPVQGQPNTAEFVATVAVRRTGLAGPGPFTGPGGLPGVGDIIVERQGPSLFDFGDGTPTGGPMVFRVTAIDPIEDWMLGQALSFSPFPGTGNAVPETEPNGAFSSANPITLGDDFVGDIEGAGQFDVATFQGVAGQHVRLRVVPGTLPNPVVQIYGSNFALLLSWNNEISLVLPATGTYYAAVASSVGGGSYVLETREGQFVDNIVHSFPASTDGGVPWLSGIDSCCRLAATQNAGTTQGNDGAPYRVQTEVRFDLPNASPVSSLTPIVNVPVDTVYSFFVPAIDPNSNTLSWRFATDDEAGGPGGGIVPDYTSIGPPNAFFAPTIDSATGLVTWDTFATTPGHLYTMQVIIEDLDPTGVPLGRSAVDFLIRMVEAFGNDPPVCEIAPAGPFVVEAGQQVAFWVEGVDDGFVTLNSGGFPPGASFSPALPTSAFGQVGSLFTWTPTAAQLGVYVISINATDEFGQQTLCSTSITVVPAVVNEPPNCSIDPAGPLTVLVGDLVAFTVSATDPNTSDFVQIDALSIPLGASAMPSLPTIGVGSASSAIQWTPAPSQVGVFQFLFVVTDEAGLQSTCEISVEVLPIVVNEPPECLINPAGPFAVLSGQTLSFTASGSDPNPSDALTLDASGVPLGATFAPALPVVGLGSVSSQFSWTPTDADAGLHVVVVSVTDDAGLTSFCTVSITVTVQAGEGCVYSQGYWKTHPAAWPTDSLTLGNVAYTKAQLIKILRQPVKGNGALILAHQLIAAKLNVANGASTTAAVDAAIATGDALLGNLVVPPIASGYLAPNAVSAIAGVLDLYNNGLIEGGPPHCGG